MLAALALLGVLGSAAPTAAAPPPSTSAVQPPVRVRLWAEEGRDLFRGGERSRLWVRTTDDAYVAVIHLAPDGRLEFLYPSSPWESGYLRRGRDLSIGRAGGGVWTVGRGTGIGYVYAIASTQPLDFRFFRQTRLGGWSFGRGGEVVRGDPFYVFDRVAEQLVPQLEGGRWNGFDDAIYSYHVGRRHSYPLYSCYDPYAGVVVRSSWGAPLYSCLQMRELLVGYPDYYYAPRRNRRVYLSDRRSAEPRYRFKEPADARASRPVAPSARSQPAPRLIPTE
ncbi:MAG: DUF4384 domain-containing protein, partial [Gemmatimonadota bacterium]|nr:DUF4384 domain-containing protein [Gemmatimonadota bacterium]